jgi:hypothetical protein
MTCDARAAWGARLAVPADAQRPARKGLPRARDALEAAVLATLRSGATRDAEEIGEQLDLAGRGLIARAKPQ